MKNEKTNKVNGIRKIKRRTFFGVLGGGALMLAAKPARSAATKTKDKTSDKDKPQMGVLVDTTMCVGCRSCEGACNEANKLPKPEKPFDDDTVLNKKRSTSPEMFTVVNRYTPEQALEITRKQQCMHCVEPACSSACLVRAMVKEEEGSVTYREDLCIGCRYCMVACPFDVPKFEYSKAMPLILKCQFCFERQKEGKLPACVEACPAEALKFGPREELIEEARSRIYNNKDDYYHHIYGENEAGGTGWMYIASVPFDKIGLPKGLGKKPYPEFTRSFLATVPLVLILWPALLIGFRHFYIQREAAAGNIDSDAHTGGRRMGK